MVLLVEDCEVEVAVEVVGSKGQVVVEDSGAPAVVLA